MWILISHLIRLCVFSLLFCLIDLSYLNNDSGESEKTKKKPECNKTTRWCIKWLILAHNWSKPPWLHAVVKILLKWDSWNHEVYISGMFVPSLELSDNWSCDTDWWFALNNHINCRVIENWVVWFLAYKWSNPLRLHMLLLSKFFWNRIETTKFTYVRSELELSDSVTLTDDSRWITTLIGL